MNRDILKEAIEKIEHNIFVREDGISQDTLAVYTLLKMHETLQSINANLENLVSNSNDEWNAKHNT